MKILLIQPPIRDFYQTSIRTQPIGLSYLAASLRTQGHEVEILDCQTDKRRPIPIPSELAYLRDFYRSDDGSPFKLYGPFSHFGMDRNEIRQRIEGSKADVFGISSSFTPYHGEALEIGRMIKEWDETKAVVMGGSHVSCDPEGVLRSPYVDYVVLGEGEMRFLLLLEKIEKGREYEIREIDGVGYRRDGEIRIRPLQGFIQDLDHSPQPARDLLDLDRYRIRKKRSTMLITSRGCPHRCAYCSACLVMGNTFRTRSPEAIIEELKTCQEQFGIQIFDIEDDNFTFEPGRAKQLLNLIIETFGERRLELSAMNGVSFASLDAELLRLMKRGGFHTLNLSFVSTDLFTKERMTRPKARIEFDQILEDAGRAGLNVIAYGIFGMPGQTIQEMADTLVYLMGKRVLIGPSIYYPTPGTPLFEECKREGLLPPHPSQWRSSAFPIETRVFSRLDLVTLFRLARVINFIKGRMDRGELDEGITWRELFRRVKEEAEVKIETESVTPSDLHPAHYNQDPALAWKSLLLCLLSERAFFRLERGAEKRWVVLREKSSKKVIDYFLETAWDHPILRSHAGKWPS